MYSFISIFQIEDSFKNDDNPDLGDETKAVFKIIVFHCLDE